MSEICVEMNFDGAAPPRCKHCGREKASHQALTLHCPRGRGNFPTFSKDTVYEPRKPRAKKPKAA